MSPARKLPTDALPLPHAQLQNAIVFVLAAGLFGFAAVIPLVGATGSLIGRVLLGVTFAVAGTWMVVGLLQMTRVYLSERGIHQPALVGAGEKFIAWNEVDRATTFGFAVHLHSGRRKIVVNVLLFKKPSDAARILRERLPSRIVAR